MFCNNCGCELADNATFCSKCGKKIKNKNIYIALVLTFILTGLGSIYAGNTKKGLALLILRVLFAALAIFSNIFGILSVLVWVYGFYEVYNDVQIANRNSSPNLINDFKNWNQQNKIIAILIICAILILTLNSFTIFSSTDSYYSDDSELPAMKATAMITIRHITEVWIHHLIHLPKMILTPIMTIMNTETILMLMIIWNQKVMIKIISSYSFIVKF